MKGNTFLLKVNCAGSRERKENRAGMHMEKQDRIGEEKPTEIQLKLCGKNDVQLVRPFCQ
jgi:hypothetical protein